MSTAIGYKESSFPESADIFDINIPEWPRPKCNGTLAEQKCVERLDLQRSDFGRKVRLEKSYKMKLSKDDDKF